MNEIVFATMLQKQIAATGKVVDAHRLSKAGQD
jgi:hypothetical protein